MKKKPGISSISTAIVLLSVCLPMIFGACKLDSPYLDAIEKQIEEDFKADKTVPGFSVIYDGNGNTAGLVPEDSNSYEEGSTATVLGNTNGLSKEGYSFTSWNTAKDGSSDAFGEGDSIIIGTEDITLYAQWSANPVYNVTYNGNGNDGGEAPSDAINYEEGQTVTVKSKGTLSLTAASFVGWNTKADGSGTDYLVDSSFTMPADDITLYAQWTYNPTYNVIYDGNGSDGASAPDDKNNYEEGAIVYVYGPGTMTRTGYTFSRWDTQADGNGIPRAPGSSFQIGAGDAALYAIWNAETYSVILDQQEGSGGTTEISAKFDASMPSATAPSRTGYTFGGYFSETLGTGSQYYSNTMASLKTWDIGGDTTLYAYWIPNSYTVTLDSRGGSGGSASVVAYFGSSMPSATAPALFEHTLLGYYTGTDGTGTQYYDGLMNSVHDWDIADSTTLYANWELNSYNITFNKNDYGAAGSMAVQTINYGGSENLTACTFTKTGWTFAGWALSADGAVTYADQYYYTMSNSNITLYAVWNAPGTYSLRDRGPAGGWIFYDKGNDTGGWRYLEAAPTDATTSYFGHDWGTSSFTVTGADGTDYGDGYQNTLDIIQYDTGTSNKAADAAAAYSITNAGVIYSDWFLPASSSLGAMYNELDQQGYGNFEDNYYWSSTEYSAITAGNKDFRDGDQLNGLKSRGYEVRAVRRF